MKISARFLLVFLLSLSIILTVFSKPAFAQTTNSANQTSNALNTDSNVPTNLHNVTQVVMLETMAGVLCQLTGVDYFNPNQRCLGVDSKNGKIGFVGNGGGMIGAMGTMISATLTPPVTTGQYVAYLKSNFGIVKPTYAAATICDATKGIGFCGLWPIVNLWIAMRNIVYLIFILVFVIVGLGIMLRLHINPQTVMTVQNQIPKIIIGIVAITFSFAIAGFLIDIMWVATYLFGAVIASAAGGIPEFNKVILSINPFDAANNATGGIVNIAGTTSSAFAHVVSSVFTGPAQNFNNGDAVAAIIGGIFQFFINMLAWLIIAIAIIVALIRLWITLILAYLNIILDVVFAPFWILAGVVPESPIGVGTWLKDLVANLAVFPMTVAFFLLADVFMKQFGQSTTGRFVPPLTGGVDSTAISALIGLGFILMLPNMLSTMKAALKAPKLDFGPIFGPVKAGGGAIFGVPKRTFEATERYNYAARASGNKERILRFFGNPIYGRPVFQEHPEPNKLSGTHGAPGPKRGGSGGEA